MQLAASCTLSAADRDNIVGTTICDIMYYLYHIMSLCAYFIGRTVEYNGSYTPVMCLHKACMFYWNNLHKTILSVWYKLDILPILRVYTTM